MLCFLLQDRDEWVATIENQILKAFQAQQGQQSINKVWFTRAQLFKLISRVCVCLCVFMFAWILCVHVQ